MPPRDGFAESASPTPCRRLTHTQAIKYASATPRVPASRVSLALEILMEADERRDHRSGRVGLRTLVDLAIGAVMCVMILSPNVAAAQLGPCNKVPACPATCDSVREDGSEGSCKPRASQKYGTCANNCGACGKGKACKGKGGPLKVPCFCNKVTGGVNYATMCG